MTFEFQKIETPSKLSAMAYEALKEKILETDIYKLSDRARIEERALAQKLGVSRTPLREAINRLFLEGFLEVVPRKGIFIVRKSKKEIIEILLARSALEGMAARLACDHVIPEDIQKMRLILAPFNPSNLKKNYLKYADANVDFHELVLAASQCKKIIDLANSLFEHMRWIRFRAVTFKERLETIHREHLSIITALEEKKPDLVEKIMRDHIEGLARYIQEKVDF